MSYKKTKKTVGAKKVPAKKHFQLALIMRCGYI